MILIKYAFDWKGVSNWKDFFFVFWKHPVGVILMISTYVFLQIVNKGWNFLWYSMNIELKTYFFHENEYNLGVSLGGMAISNP